MKYPTLTEVMGGKPRVKVNPHHKKDAKNAEVTKKLLDHYWDRVFFSDAQPADNLQWGLNQLLRRCKYGKIKTCCNG